MPGLPCTHTTWHAFDLLSVPPSIDDPGPGYVPPVIATGNAGEQWLVSVADFPSGRNRGVLWGATIERLTLQAYEQGANSVDVSFPATPQLMRIFGDPVPGGVDQQGRQLYDVKGAGQRELLIGSTVDGKVQHRFQARNPTKIGGGRVSVSGTGWVGGGGLVESRIIGAPTRRNELTWNGSFEFGLDGWRLVGNDVQAGVVGGGVDGGQCVWVTGTPSFDSNYLEATVRIVSPAQPWGRAAIGALAYVLLPSGVDIDDFTLVSVGVWDGTKVVWPDVTLGDQSALVDSDMVRGDWVQQPVEAVGFLPTPPFTADVTIRLHPTHTTAKTYYDGTQIIRNENTSTRTSADLVTHVATLLKDEQHGRAKSDWGINVVYGAGTGKSEIGTWWHSDGQSLPEALDALVQREDGPDVWDATTGGRSVKVAKRRGSVRRDIVVRPWDTLGSVEWSVDPAAQVSALRATSGSGAMWGGADRGATVPRVQVVDAILPAPGGMTPNQLQAWVNGRLKRLSVIPGSMTALLRPNVAARLSIGDTVQVVAQSGSAGHVDWMHLQRKMPSFTRGFVECDFVTDPDLGSR